MNLLVICIALLVVATKGLDCLTTLRAVPVAAAETNPLARRIMHRLGVHRSVALVFVLATIWTCALATVTILMDSAVYAALFVGLGLFVATVQAAVAHTNWTGRDNAITSRVLHCHRAAARWIR